MQFGTHLKNLASQNEIVRAYAVLMAGNMTPCRACVNMMCSGFSVYVHLSKLLHICTAPYNSEACYTCYCGSCLLNNLFLFSVRRGQRGFCAALNFNDKSHTWSNQEARDSKVNRAAVVRHE